MAEAASSNAGCSRCGTFHKPRHCPAYGKTCAKCGLKNHFAKDCWRQSRKSRHYVQNDFQADKMVKIFVGNLGDEADAEKLKTLFEEYGTVTECDILNRFGFVHMDSESAAKTAIDNLHHSLFQGKQINVEVSTGGNTRRPREGRSGERGRRGGRDRDRAPRNDDRYDPYPAPRAYYDDPHERRYDPYDRPPLRDPYRDPYYDRDPYGRYPPPERDYYRYPPPERDPYLRRRDPYGRPPPPPVEGDPYARPPPEYYYEATRPERPEHAPRPGYSPEGGYPPESKGYDPSGYADAAIPAEGYPAHTGGYRGRGGAAGHRRGASNGNHANPDPTSLYMSFE